MRGQLQIARLSPCRGGAFAVIAACAPMVSLANPALDLFRDNCFSPFLTAAKAQEIFDIPGLRWDFYDLDPFSSAAPSPVTGRAATPGTDRRCEIAFDGDHVVQGEATVLQALTAEGITSEAQVPADFPAQPDAALVAARQLNPRRIAVVQVGLRSGPKGPETYLSVERLTPREVTQ
ncbi:MAG: succinyl-CoA synthetase subunit beta [Pseudomonadota bacterium]